MKDNLKGHLQSLIVFSFLQILVAVSQVASGQVQFEGELLTAWIRGSQTPPIVTTSPNGTEREDAGVLGTSGAAVLYGGGPIDTEHRAGTRLALRWNSELEGNFGLYLSGLHVGDSEDDFVLASNKLGIPILSRPFFNANTLKQDAELVAYPNVLNGQVSVATDSELYGVDSGVIFNWKRTDSRKVDLLCGYRFLSFIDAFHVREELTSTDLGGFIPVDTQFIVEDRFSTINYFHGGRFGLAFVKSTGNWRLGSEINVAFGGLTRRSQIRGGTRVEIPGLTPDQYDVGLLAMPTNSGTNRSSTFAAVPDLKLKGSRVVNHFLSLDFGYNLLIVPDLWRAAEQIDYTVNESQLGGGILVGTPRPMSIASSSDLWLQCLSIGVTLQR